MVNENDDEKTIETKETIQEAQERYDEILKDKHETDLADLREKYILDQISIKKTGYREGREAGVKETKVEIAKKMISQGGDTNTIAMTTELSEEEIENLKNTES